MANLVSGALATLPRSTTGPVAIIFTPGDPVLLYDNDDRLRFQLEIMASKPPNMLVQASGDLRRAMMSSPLLAATGGTEVVVLNARQVTLVGPSDDIDVYHLGKSTTLRHLADAYAQTRSDVAESVRTGAHLNEIAIAIAHHLWPDGNSADARSARTRQGTTDTAQRMQQFAAQIRSAPEAIDAADLLGLAAFRTLVQLANKDGAVPAQLPITGFLDMASLRKAGQEIRCLFKTDLGDVPIAITAPASAVLQTRGGEKLTLQCEPGSAGRVRVLSIQ
jgi:hypothetical protein